MTYGQERLQDSPLHLVMRPIWDTQGEIGATIGRAAHTVLSGDSPIVETGPPTLPALRDEGREPDGI